MNSMKGQKQVSYKEAQNQVCKNCGHYMSMHIFREMVMNSNTILDENNKMQTLTDEQMEETFGVKQGETIVVMDYCKGMKGQQKEWTSKTVNIDTACDCDDYEESGQ